MKKLSILASVAALAIFSSQAFAADAIRYRHETPLPDTNWSGLYTAGMGGFGWGKADHRHENVNNFGGPGGTYSNDGSGGVYGAAVGYNHEFPNHVVVGVEGAIRSGSKLDDGGAYKMYHNTTSTKTRYVTSVTGKVGYAAGRWMPYVKAGWVGADVVSGQNYSPVGLTPTTWESHKFMNGYTVGAGVNYAVNDKVFVGLEYDYDNYGRHTFSGRDSTGRATKISSNLSSQTIMAIVGVKF